jgi:hypothetical protein
LAWARFWRHSRQPAIRPVLRTRQAYRDMRRLRVDRVERRSGNECAGILAIIPQYVARALSDLNSSTPISGKAMNAFGSKELTALTATLSPVTPTKMIRHPEPARSEQARQQAQEDQAGPSGPQAQPEPGRFVRSAHCSRTEATFPQLRSGPAGGKLSKRRHRDNRQALSIADFTPTCSRSSGRGNWQGSSLRARLLSM